jgi:hypothetical protein
LTEPKPALRVLSLGAGVQSSTLLLLAAEGAIAPVDAAIFSDTGWEPRAVYDHLDRLEAEVAGPAGIPIYRVTAGNIRDDALDPVHRFASMPLYVKNPDGTEGMARRQCTSEYKLKPIKRKVRDLLGYVHPNRVPAGVFAQQLIGISTDEQHRARLSDVNYAQNVFPLLDLGWSRRACLAYLEDRGWASTPKSACIGCPFHGNRAWRHLRDTSPDEWADAVDFDASIRAGSARALAQGQELRGSMYLHRSRVPLGEAPIDRVTLAERKADQITVDDLLDEKKFEQLYAEDDVPGCSPYACREDGLAPSDDEMEVD